MHERKKGGERKDKKNQRMHEAEAERKETAAPPKLTHDEKDIITFKPGSGSDRTVQPGRRAGAGQGLRS